MLMTMMRAGDVPRGRSNSGLFLALGSVTAQQPAAYPGTPAAYGSGWAEVDRKRGVMESRGRDQRALVIVGKLPK